jgi:DNA-binding NtrC family response regulator
MDRSILNNKRILAVDDEPDVLDTIEEFLEEYKGLVIDKATDYETGYQLLRSWTYDIVILDIMGVRGFDLLNAAVSLGFPTVMLTAHALSVDNLKMSIEMGARTFIPKEKMTEIVSFLEDVLILDYRSFWRKSLDRLFGTFNAKFGSEWQKTEKEFLDQIMLGRYEPKPVILRK